MNGGDPFEYKKKFKVTVTVHQIAFWDTFLVPYKSAWLGQKEHQSSNVHSLVRIPSSSNQTNMLMVSFQVQVLCGAQSVNHEYIDFSIAVRRS